MASKDEKFLLVSLNEDKAKKLAQIISNDTCRKIIDLLTEGEATETELAKKLKIAISTIHYNISHLMKAELVLVDEFHYSKKGKEINHYKLANKYIIIAPKQTTGIKEALRKILPVGLITIVGAAVIEFFNMFTMRSSATFGESAA
jgi:DNA-binding transcriptional ArsR family regulator